MSNIKIDKIHAIILSWNNYEDIVSCICSIKNSTKTPDTIVIVDNHSTDGSPIKIHEKYKDDTNVHIIINDDNYGFAKGINIGIKYAIEDGSNFVFIVNDDADISSTCIEHLLDAFNLSPDIGIASPRIFYGKSQRIWQGASQFSGLKIGVNSLEKNLEASQCSIENQFVSCATGCAMLISSNVMNKIGLFDQDFFFYFEDLDFTTRVIDGGFKIVYVPISEVYHKIDNIEKDRTSPFVMYNLSKSYILFAAKRFTGFYFAYAIILHLFVYTPYRIIQIIKGTRSTKSILYWFKGTKDALFVVLRQSNKGH